MASSEETPITINNRVYRTVREGKATILAPYGKEIPKSKKVSNQTGSQPRNNDEGHQAVFYNPIQQYNRDLSVLAILVYGESAIQIKSSRRYLNKEKGKRRREAKTKPNHNSETRDPVVGASSKKRNADEAEFEKDQEVKIDTKKAKGENGAVGGDAALQGQNTTIKTSYATHADDHQTSSKVCGQEISDQPLSTTAFTILDALSASGLRAIRYAKEIPFATTVVANDLLPEAVKAIDLNIEHNELKGKVFSNIGDARQFMYSKTGNEASNPGPGYVHKFDVVDLDPYGTAAPFLDAAIQAVTDGGMLCVTCTDAGVWASNGYPEKAFALYGGIPVKGPHSHEAGLRLILHSIATSASKYGIAIEPLLSLSIDFYGRLFIRVHKSQQDVKLLAGATMLVYNCDQGCGAWETQLVARNQGREAKNGEAYFKHGFAQGPSTDRSCQHCGSKTHLGGPMWAGPLHNPVFIQKILDKLDSVDKTVYGTVDRVKGMLTCALEEEDIGWPLNPDESSTVHKVGMDDKQKGIQNDAYANMRKNDCLIARMPPQLLSESPFLFLPTYLAKVLSLPTPAEDPLRGAFLALGYHCSRSHCKPGSFKTNAPWTVIWEVMREWARQNEAGRLPRLLGEGEFLEKGSVKKSSPGWNILKRLRGRDDDSLLVARTREMWLRKLGLGHGGAEIETTSDLQNLLKSALYELEHPKRVLNTVPPIDLDSISAGDANGNNDRHGGDLPQPVGTKSDAICEKVADSDLKSKRTGKALVENGGDVSELDIVFDTQLGRAYRESKGGKLVRYQINPRANWGPMVRAGTGSN